MTQENELRNCPFCDHPVSKPNQFVYCDVCDYRLHPERFKDAACWKIIDQDKQAIKELVGAVTNLIQHWDIIRPPKDQEIIRAGSDILMDRIKEILSKYSPEKR